MVLKTIITIKQIGDDDFYDDYFYRYGSGAHDTSAFRFAFDAKYCLYVGTGWEGCSRTNEMRMHG